MRPIVHLIGILVTITAIVFFVGYVSRQLSGLDPAIWSSIHRTLLLLSLGIYIAHAFLYPIAWRTLLGFTGHHPSYREATAIILESQFAKYVPGNIAQPMGRIYLSKTRNLPIGAVTLTLGVEVAWVAATGSVLALFGGAAEAASDGILPPGVSTPILILAVTSAVVLPFILPSLVKKIVGRVPQLKNVRLPDFRPTVPGTLICLTIYSVNFLVFGSMTWLIASAIGVESAPFAAIMVCSITGWLVGFLTPGSPAGAGVRDSIIVLGLSAVMPPPQAALVALLHRLLTATGDCLLYLIGKWIKARLARPADPVA